jgi:creatinine amidohydrolase/Fe(II)-dependent formamide hydrolase-like protein
LPYPGSVSIRRSVVEEYLFDLLVSFAADGFRHLVLTSQHVDPPWVRTADNICERINEEYSARAIQGFERLVVDLLEDFSPLDLPGLDSRGEAHAGVFETAPMLYLAEHLVRRQLLKELSPQPIEFSQMKEAESFRELGNGLGYTGNLSQATEEIGARIIEHYAARFKDLILRHVRGEDVYDLLRFSGF